MAELVEEKNQKLDCYRHVVKIDLNNRVAQENIRKLVRNPEQTITKLDTEPSSTPVISPLQKPNQLDSNTPSRYASDLNTPIKFANPPHATTNKSSRNSENTLYYLGYAAIPVVLLICAFTLIFGDQIYSLVKPTPFPTSDWRLSPNYVSEKQFGDNWPFTVSEGLVECGSTGVVVLHTNEGTFGLTGHSNEHSYVNIKDSGLWKTSADGWGNVSLSTFTSYAVSLCP